jgi:D-alanyl-D-alanine carboxypeptidase
VTLDDVVATRCAETDVPALAAVVVRSGLVESAVAGVRRLGSTERTEPNDRFHLGSNAKSMTATLAAVAVERGAVDWSSSAARVLGVRGANPGTTLQHLLTHAAGIQALEEDYELDALPIPQADPADQRRAIAELLLTNARAFEPGSSHRYSNGGYTVAAAVVERATGVPWEAATADEIFEPLEMDAGLGWPAAGGAAQPWGHWAREDTFEPHDPDDGYGLPPVIAPAGDVHASLPSYGEFLRMHLRGLRGESTLLRPETVAHLHTPAAGRYALGWGAQELEGAVASVHSGSADTFFAVAVAAVANAAGEKAQRTTVELLRKLLRSHAD